MQRAAQEGAALEIEFDRQVWEIERDYLLDDLVLKRMELDKVKNKGILLGDLQMERLAAVDAIEEERDRRRFEQVSPLVHAPSCTPPRARPLVHALLNTTTLRTPLPCSLIACVWRSDADNTCDCIPSASFVRTVAPFGHTVAPFVPHVCGPLFTHVCLACPLFPPTPGQQAGHSAGPHPAHAGRAHCRPRAHDSGHG